MQKSIFVELPIIKLFFNNTQHILFNTLFGYKKYSFIWLKNIKDTKF
jgi:hypothetical protein